MKFYVHFLKSLAFQVSLQKYTNCSLDYIRQLVFKLESADLFGGMRKKCNDRSWAISLGSVKGN